MPKDMKPIYLSDFVDLVSKAGSPKVTKISDIKNRNDYDPISDFYKSLREGIVKIHKNGKAKVDLSSLENPTDKKKKDSYSKVVLGYKKWWGRKNIKWGKQLSGSFIHSGVEVKVNPELGLNIEGILYIIKLHLKDEKLTKPKANVVTALMEMTLRDKVSSDTILAILDVRNSRLYTFSDDLKKHAAMVKGELAYVENVWDDL